MWISIVVRDRILVAVRDDTKLAAGDEIVVLADPDLHDVLAKLFEVPRQKGSSGSPRSSA